MKERRSNQDLIEQAIKVIESGERPIDVFIGKSLTEIFLSGAYKTTYLKRTPAPSEPLELQAIRIIARREGKITSAFISLFPDGDARRIQADKMIQETQKMTVHDDQFQSASTIFLPALDKLKEKGLITVAAMAVSRSIETRDEILQVNYPQLYLDLLQAPEFQKENLAFALTLQILKKVPFGDDISLQVPSH